ncbi:hypothetical protein LVD15_15500 [Fulvivirga maritima]|uniref:hypothetical protein n=1 Tax=Fulvivirga maritima TaxID=2904247 RepID=UPI001F31066E|nr:hypothetical protein [Fulvivirga maritima]UII24715.1 hypothetical protein LVD15_15500 [Fulvivirga maritima]
MTSFEKLFERYLSGEINSQDTRELMKMINEGEYDDWIKHRIDKVINEEPYQYQQLSQEKGDIILKNILQKNEQTKEVEFRPQHTRNYIKYGVAIAASISLLVIAGLFF